MISLTLVGIQPLQAASATTDCTAWGVDANGEFQCTAWANTDPVVDPSTLPAPTGLAVSNRTTSSLRLSWNAYDAANGYVISISTDNANTWKEVVSQNVNAYQGLNLTDLKTASAMWIRVAALTPAKTPFSDAVMLGFKCFWMFDTDFFVSPDFLWNQTSFLGEYSFSRRPRIVSL